MARVFALTTRGLEAVSKREMAALPGASLRETSYRRVALDFDGSLVTLLQLRTVDDVYLEVGTWEGLSHTRAALDDVRGRAAALELIPAAERCADVRPIGTPPVFSVSVSFVGKRNYSAEEVKAVVAAGVAEQTGWQPTADDRVADLNLRLFIEHERVHLGLRLARTPLHDRAYKRIQRPGALKPPIAAALLEVCGMEAGMRLLDPCCGSGTILIEAALNGLVPLGGDQDAEAVLAAQANAAGAGLRLEVSRWDMRALPLADRSVDGVVCNLPWGLQVAVADDLTPLYRELCGEIERVLVRGGRATLLTNAPDRLQFERLRLDERLNFSLFGQTPTASVYTAIR